MTWLGEVDVDAITEEDLAAAEDGIAVRKMRLKLRIYVVHFFLHLCLWYLSNQSWNMSNFEY